MSPAFLFHKTYSDMAVIGRRGCHEDGWQTYSEAPALEAHVEVTA
jgi:hypothetical protein